MQSKGAYINEQILNKLLTDFDNLIIEKNYCLSDPEVVSKAIELENILNNTLKSQDLIVCDFLFLNCYAEHFHKSAVMLPRISIDKILSKIIFFDTVFKNNFTVQIFAFFNIGNRDCLDFNKFTVLVIQCTYQ